MQQGTTIIVELTVNNHPGVMSHITGLFARRAFNLEGILCSSLEKNRAVSSVFLMVQWDRRLDQTIVQLGKLYDVLSVTVRKDCSEAVFRRLHEHLPAPSLPADI